VAEVALHQPVIVWYWSVIDAIQRYWNARIHDLEMTDAEVGTKAFFEDLDDYRFDKLHYLPKLVDFSSFRGQRLLEVGCGIGTDLVRFARGGARVTGVDLSETAIDLARKNFALSHVAAEELRVANGEQLPYPNEVFDVVYAHGVVQYTSEPAQLIRECHRVLKPGGTAGARARRRAGAEEVFDRGVSRAVEAVCAGGDHSRTLSREVTAPQRLEGRGIQHDVRRRVQRLAAIVGEAARVAFDGLLQKTLITDVNR
jgi:SAM-dependent methyltransferase